MGPCVVSRQSLIEIVVDNLLEMYHSGNFTDGAFGFYNYSQAYVEHAGTTAHVLPDPSAVPLPAGLMGALGLVRRRQG